jgi:hypothetical protein
MNVTLAYFATINKQVEITEEQIDKIVDKQTYSIIND